MRSLLALTNAAFLYFMKNSWHSTIDAGTRKFVDVEYRSVSASHDLIDPV